MVEVVDEQQAVEVDADRWARLAEACAADLGVPEPWELTLRFVGPEAMAGLNAEHMGHDGPTDVLSFPVDGPELAEGAEPPPAGGPPVVLGDLVVCPEVAVANAAGHAGRPEDEMALLVVHGVLHLWGMDHAEPDERAAMQTAERQLLAAHHGPLAADPWAAGAT